MGVIEDLCNISRARGSWNSAEKIVSPTTTCSI